MLKPWQQYHPEPEGSSEADASGAESVNSVSDLAMQKETDNLDLANQSLLDTLRLGFYILLGIMVFLCAIFFISGAFQVQKGKVAIKMRFGQIERDRDGKIIIYNEGFHWAWPEPFEEKRFVSLQTYSREIDERYWLFLDENDAGKPFSELKPNNQGLDPELDGVLLTGDQRFAHMKLTIQFQVDAQNPSRIALFAQNVAERNEIDTRNRAWSFVQKALDQALVRVASGADSNDLWVSERFNTHPTSGLSHVKNLTQAALNEMETGLLITELAIKQTVPPRDVGKTYEESKTRRLVGNQKVNEAKQYRNQQLNQTAGQAYQALELLIEWRAEAAKNQEEGLVELIDQEMKKLFTRDQTAEQAIDTVWEEKSKSLLAQLKSESENAEIDEQQLKEKAIYRSERAKANRAAQPVLVGGAVAKMMNNARRYSNSTQQKLKSELELFRPWQQQIAANPNVEATIRQTMLQQVLETTLSHPRIEIFQMPYEEGKALELILKPDEKQRQRRIDLLKAEELSKQ